MDNIDSNIKSQQTGGLKLMTVFIAVLALHVVVIGGFTVYHLMSGGSTDADLTTTDKTHKAATPDSTSPDATSSDKSATTATAPTEVATIPANTPTPDADSASPTVTTTATPAPASTPAPTAAAVTPTASAAPTPASTLTPAPALTSNTSKPAPVSVPAEVVDEGSQTPSGPISAEEATTPAPMDAAPTPSVPMAAGPVHMPPATASMPVHTHEQIYVVKITDSYKKIAHAHHLTVAQLKEANHIRTDVLHTGQKLIIPSGKTVVATTTALDSSPTTTPESTVAMTANLASSPSDQTPGTTHLHVYTVVKGDTLIKIAHRFRTTTSALMAENDITDPTRLSIGKKLKIPSEESRSAKNSTPTSTQPSQVQAKENAASAQLANFVP